MHNRFVLAVIACLCLAQWAMLTRGEQGSFLKIAELTGFVDIIVRRALWNSEYGQCIVPTVPDSELLYLYFPG